MKKLRIGVLPMLYIILITGSINYADPATQDTVIRYLNISLSAFNPTSGGMTDYIRDPTWLYGKGAGQTFYAPVYLPESAKVTELRVRLYDSDVTYDLTASLVRSVWEGPTELMARVISSGSAGTQDLTDTTIEHNLIDNETYRYSVGVSMPAIGGAHSLYAMRIKYKISRLLIGIGDSESLHNPSYQYDVHSYPTPFSKVTAVKYSVQKKGEVVIEIYDEAGRLIRTLVDDVMPQGSYTTRWDGKDTEGRKVSAGSYFCVVKTNGSSTTKVVYVK